MLRQLIAQQTVIRPGGGTGAVAVAYLKRDRSGTRGDEADDAEDKKNVSVRKLRVASSAARRAGPASRKANARAVLLAGKVARKSGKQAAVRVASDSSTGGRTKSSRAAREL